MMYIFQNAEFDSVRNTVLKLNHAKAFRDEVAHAMPDDEKARLWLKSEDAYGFWTRSYECVESLGNTGDFSDSPMRRVDSAQHRLRRVGFSHMIWVSDLQAVT